MRLGSGKNWTEEAGLGHSGPGAEAGGPLSSLSVCGDSPTMLPPKELLMLIL